MRYFLIPLSRTGVMSVFFAFMILGILLIYIKDIRVIITGFGIFTVALHEFGHLIALKQRGYDVAGIVISLWPPGIGPLPKQPIKPKDSTLVYFSGLICIIVPFYLMYFTIEFGILFLVGTFLMSVADIIYWWQVNKDKKQ